MEDDVIFNFDDLNVSEETTEIFKEETPPAPPVDTTKEEVKEDISIDIPETKTEEKDEIDSSKVAPSSEQNSSQSTLYALVQHLKDEGALFVGDELEKVDNIEELKAVLAESHKKARFNGMTESQQRYLEALENGVPIKEYETIEKEINTFSNIKQENIEKDQQLQYELIAIDFMNSGIEQEKAMKLAELSVKAEGDNSIAEAKKALENILEHKKSKYQELISSKKEQTEIDLKSIKEAIDGKEKLLEMPINDNTRTKLFDLMTTKVASDDNGLPLNKLQKFQRDNPIEANILMNYLFMMTNEGKDLGLIKTSTTSTAAKELENKLKQLNFDKDGNLIIPDEMVSNKNNSKNTTKENLTINI